MTRPARIPSDVHRPDRIIGPFTARQVAILAATAAMLYLAWTVLRSVSRCRCSASPRCRSPRSGSSSPSGSATGSRWTGCCSPRSATAPRPRQSTPHPAQPAAGDVPGWIAVRATDTTGGTRAVRVRGHRRPPGFPARAVTPGPAHRTEPAGVGVVDLGSDGLAWSPPLHGQLRLRTPAEQDGLVAGFARYLHTLTAAMQILVRAHPLDLTEHLHNLRVHAAVLPHPAFAAAAAGTPTTSPASPTPARRGRGLLHPPGAARPARTGRPAAPGDGPAGAAGCGAPAAAPLHDAAALLAPLGVGVTPLNAAQATALLAAPATPTPPRPAGERPPPAPPPAGRRRTPDAATPAAPPPPTARRRRGRGAPAQHRAAPMTDTPTRTRRREATTSGRCGDLNPAAAGVNRRTTGMPGTTGRTRRRRDRRGPGRAARAPCRARRPLGIGPVAEGHSVRADQRGPDEPTFLRRRDRGRAAAAAGGDRRGLGGPGVAGGVAAAAGR